MSEKFESVKHVSCTVKIGNSTLKYLGMFCYVNKMEDYTVISDFDLKSFIQGHKNYVINLIKQQQQQPSQNKRNAHKRQIQVKCVDSIDKSLLLSILEVHRCSVMNLYRGAIAYDFSDAQYVRILYSKNVTKKIMKWGG